MSLNFPDNPTVGDIYTDTGSGFSYEWDGTVWKSYTPSSANNISVLDDISSSFDGIQDTFALTASSTPITPANSQQLRVVLGGIVQSPGVDYTTVGSNITFTTPPSGGLSFSGVSLGPAVAVNVPGDGTVTPVKLSTGGPVWNTGGDVNISGITTINNKVKVGVGTTALIVEGDARITGILTIGTSSITLDGSTNAINVGTGVTITTTEIKVGGVTIGDTGIDINGSVLNESGIGIATASGIVGTGATIIDFRGAGISTITVSSGIATINVEGGGGGGSFSPVNYIFN